MTDVETMQRLKEMESRYDDGFSVLDRSYLDSLYFSLFGKEITNKGCGDCYRDAYMEICIKLKKSKAMPKKSDFVLKAGAIITFFGERQCYSNANITDEAALRFLALNPRNESLFEKLPADWKERIAIPSTDNPSPAPIAGTDESEKDALIARLTEENQILRKENESLKAAKPRRNTKKKSDQEQSALSPSPEESSAESVESAGSTVESSSDESPADESSPEQSPESDEVSIEDPEEDPSAEE